MAYNEVSRKASAKYRAAHIKRVPLDMQISDYEKLKSAATANSESVNGYIKQAIVDRMKIENAPVIDCEDTLPQYATDPAFSTLCHLCEMCGVRVKFRKGDDTCMGRTSGRVIEMGGDEEYKNPEHATIVLGHELSHILEKYRPADSELTEYDIAVFPSDDVEDLCDCWGVALYQLVYNIIGHRIEIAAQSATE